jgi:hypothetical protein
MVIETTTIASSVQRLFPNHDLDEVMVKLLLERAQKNLIKYRFMVQQFQAKYGQDFDTWRQTVLTTEPGFEVEQDYFDWEMAVTAIADMEEEIELLRHLQQETSAPKRPPA